jgi:hypothetical protein
MALIRMGTGFVEEEDLAEGERYCDTCDYPMTEDEYGRNMGLCYSCREER